MMMEALLKSIMRIKVIRQFVTKPSTVEGWVAPREIADLGKGCFIIGGAVGSVLDIMFARAQAQAEVEGQGHWLGLRLGSFLGAHALTTRLSRNAVYQLRGGKRLHIDDALIHGFSGATFITLLYPPVGIFSDFPTRFLVFAAAQTIFPY